ncbi:hypothetical protein N7468_004163 [Penicillium chermesinum]|uniref:Uncharacterized protein n=1 Tax=Penicillium chermesinum TaxID=63820 RepID=A0A9W9TU30_9EURO|nr:uncharacterized protein N7468_004163 [Penicillium chermesinum]KAJ5239544.1 hypothetical protein N7468_004163 [Penicillium chermesinum]KAJ6141203.1 hypothetical protein N7470_010099 [Penicillium chermesinum]
MHERSPATTGPDNERRNIFEDIVAEENVLQFVGSANGHTTTARKITVKRNNIQCLGDASDTTIQKIFGDRANMPMNEEHAPHEQQERNFQGTGYTLRSSS